MKRINLIFSLFIFATTLSFAQSFGLPTSPISWKFQLQAIGDGNVDIIASASIDNHWHMYGTDIPDGGPTPTEISFDNIVGAEVIGKFEAFDSDLITQFDKTFQMMIGYYEHNAYFRQKIKITDAVNFLLEGDVRAQACDDTNCTPPLPTEFVFTANDIPAQTLNYLKQNPSTALGNAQNSSEAIDAGNINELDGQQQLTKQEMIAGDDSVLPFDLWKPVIGEIQTYGDAGGVASSSSLGWLFILGVGGGILALLTPCVWPLIPMTVSFFLKRNKKDKAKAVNDAITYGISIIFIYVGLGLLITVAFGASALNELSTNAIFNIFFGLLLIFFAASFLGAFEIVLPSSWANKMDSKADSTTGFVSIFFMAFTLAIVSFSCTGPVIGTVLVQAANSGEYLGPILVMFGFSLALAIPFSLFALFPSWLNSMPDSGGWQNVVKVVLGFLELALALKFFSVADMAYGWRILDREVFLVLWIVIFALLGIYLLGKLRFKHDDPVEKISVFRLFLAIISLAFAIYLIPGLWGAPLRTISAFSPPLTTQDFSLYDGEVRPDFHDYETGMAYARKVNKPVLLDFSGYGCVNCRKMEANVWTNPDVKHIIDNDYVLITLMVDDKTKLPKPITVDENGRMTKLKTVGDKWSYFQRHKFGVNSQPYYVLLNDEGMPIGPSYAFNENVKAYINFLNTGLLNFKKQQNEK